MTQMRQPEGGPKPAEFLPQETEIPQSMWPVNDQYLSHILEILPVSREEILQLQYPWELLVLLQKKLVEQVTEIKISTETQISPQVHIEGPVWIEAGVKILPFSVIIGPVIIGKNTIIGNHTQIRSSIIGPNSLVGWSTEFVRSVSLNGCSFHHNYVGDSFLGSEVSMGGGAKFSNLRFDHNDIKSAADKQLVDTELEKLGCIVGNNTAIGANALAMPGIKIGNNCLVGPGVHVHRDLPDNSKIRVIQEQLISPINKFDK